MKKQCIVRTFPANYTNPTAKLREALTQGWIVVFSTPFECGDGKKGTEYILEREED